MRSHRGIDCICNLGTVVGGADPRCRLSGRERKTRPAFASATAVQILEARDAGLSAKLNVRLKSNLAAGGRPSYGDGMTDPVRVMLEQSKKKRVVACAFD